MKIEERLDLLKEELKNENLIKRKSSGGEIPFYIFDYPAEKELLIRETIIQIQKNFTQNNIKIKEINLYQLALEVISLKITDKQVLDFEIKNGSNKLLEKLKLVLNANIINQKIKEKLSNDDDLVFLTGIGNAWPLLRAHSILNNAQIIVEKPFIVFYPGTYTQYDLTLFGRLPANNYYRAFRLIDYTERGNLK